MTFTNYNETDIRDGKVTVNGNWGELICDPVTGNVLAYNRGGDYEKEGDGYDNITRLDVDEWRHTYPEGDITAGHDILDFGSWDKDDVYVGPEEDWRFNLWAERDDIKVSNEATEKYRTWFAAERARGDASDALSFIHHVAKER